MGQIGNKGVMHPQKLQDYWSLTIRLLSVISRTLVGRGGLTPLQRWSQCILQPQLMLKCLNTVELGNKSWQQQVKAIQSDQRHKHQLTRFWPLKFWDAQGILFIDYLGKGKIINCKYYIALLVRLKEEIAKKNSHKWSRKKCSFTKTMHRVTSWLQRWQNYMSCTLNCFCTHPLLQNWAPETIGCLQTSKECSGERNLAPMKKWYQKLGHIFRSNTNCSKKKKKHWIVREM